MNKSGLNTLLALAALMLAACMPIRAPAASASAAATAAPAAEAEAPAPGPSAGRLVLATTTSTQDSGLLDDILPAFTAETGIPVDVIAVGSGQAMQIGKDGNADVLLVHSPKAEEQFMAEGHGARRDPVMYNDFVIVGPAADPVGIAGMTSAADALAAIAAGESPFVSRGDESGTHAKEKAVWAAAAIEPAGDWYISAGQGMGAVLNMSNEQQAYTLTDRATYLARQGDLDLKILVEGDPILFNPYSVITVNPDKNPNIQADAANQFADWIVSVPAQGMIGAFRVDQFGQPLFTPDSEPWKNQ